MVTFELEDQISHSNTQKWNGRSVSNIQVPPVAIVVNFDHSVKAKSKFINLEIMNILRLTHTERQASVASEASDLCNGSGIHLEWQVKRHHRLTLVTLLLPLTLTLDAPLDARCGYTLNFNSKFVTIKTREIHEIN